MLRRHALLDTSDSMLQSNLVVSVHDEGISRKVHGFLGNGPYA